MADPIRILVVEDEPDIRTLLQLCLVQVGGFSVELCASGRDALARLSGLAPDLILMDVMMPDQDGPATLRALRARGNQTPVVFLTAKARPEEMAEWKAGGALGVIAKPFDPMALPDEIRGLWAARST